MSGVPLLFLPSRTFAPVGVVFDGRWLLLVGSLIFRPTFMPRALRPLEGVTPVVDQQFLLTRLFVDGALAESVQWTVGSTTKRQASRGLRRAFKVLLWSAATLTAVARQCDRTSVAIMGQSAWVPHTGANTCPERIARGLRGSVLPPRRTM